MLAFDERGKLKYMYLDGEKPLGAKERSNNKLNPHNYGILPHGVSRLDCGICVNL